jgi:hypothetical protein
MSGGSMLEFRAVLLGFMRDDVEGRATEALQDAAQIAAEAVVIGNMYGPGAPLDTGFLRASFRVSRNAPDDGPSTPPPTPAGRKAGDRPLFPVNRVNTRAAATMKLGEDLFITTMAEYATYLEEGSMTRRHGPPQNVGTPTHFIAPVEARWPQILDDAARRAGYGT